MTKIKYLFEKPLIEGIIKSRPNRFIMLVEISGKLEKCHCPSTGKIGGINFENSNIKCFLSEATTKNRSTNFTVEALKIPRGPLIGINQTKSNSYVSYFLENNFLPKMIKSKKVKREVKLNNSRIDFLLDDKNYIEVKTPLRFLPFGKKPSESKFNSTDRLLKHFTDISNQVDKDRRAIVLLCYTYDAPVFSPPKRDDTQHVNDIARDALKKGLEYWQINIKIDKKGVSLLKYFPLNLFD